jgi:hypothetical protein
VKIIRPSSSVSSNLSPENQELISTAKNLHIEIYESVGENRIKALKYIHELCKCDDNVEILCLNENPAVALKNLPFSDENKTILIHDKRFLSLIYQAFTLSIDNAPECKGKNPDDDWYTELGEGGQDLIVVENLLEIVLQLLFMVYNSQSSIRSTFNIPPYDLKEMMEGLLNLSAERKLSRRKFIEKLLKTVKSFLSIDVCL